MELYQEKVKAINYPEGDKSLEKSYDSLNRNKKVVTVVIKDGDDLLTLAFQYYHDETYWWVIAFHNGIINPFELTVGDIIEIPYDNI